MKQSPIVIDGSTIHVNSFLSGHKQSIVLIHGIGVSSDYYGPYARCLSKWFDVYCLDLPGYGKTPKPSTTLQIPELAKVVVSFVATMKITHCTIVGQSMGSQIVAHALRIAPATFQKALLLAPTTNAAEKHILTQALRLLQDSLRESYAANKVVFKNYVRMGIFRYVSTLRSMLSDSIENTLHTIQTPILIACGEHDVIAPPEWAGYLAKHTPNATLKTIADGLHLFHFSKPKQLAIITKEFIEG